MGPERLLRERIGVEIGVTSEGSGNGARQEVGAEVKDSEIGKEATEGGIGPERRLRERARKRREGQRDREEGIGPETRPGTRESSERAERRPMSEGSRPDRPGEPARGSPRASATTRSARPDSWEGARIGGEVPDEEGRAREVGETFGWIAESGNRSGENGHRLGVKQKQVEEKKSCSDGGGSGHLRLRCCFR
ncbi:hypothetical protein HPP92_016873 [Vanilla planifolia]|uniref:Uncharacterized protein n=1 Tax=Vanilla planifolia TaxID=51239 RepID=A0A835QEW6_VANPL|nr:hypothetical protein HPP92_016873 [Vanilla planifolia]